MNNSQPIQGSWRIFWYALITATFVSADLGIIATLYGFLLSMGLQATITTGAFSLYGLLFLADTIISVAILYIGVRHGILIPSLENKARHA